MACGCLGRTPVFQQPPAPTCTQAEGTQPGASGQVRCSTALRACPLLPRRLIPTPRGAVSKVVCSLGSGHPQDSAGPLCRPPTSTPLADVLMSWRSKSDLPEKKRLSSLGSQMSGRPDRTADSFFWCSWLGLGRVLERRAFSGNCLALRVS